MADTCITFHTFPTALKNKKKWENVGWIWWRDKTLGQISPDCVQSILLDSKDLQKIIQPQHYLATTMVVD